ncbi:MAG: acyltransferase [Candidatus Competibacteraceae bacterium]
MVIGQFIQGRDNNYNLLRHVAAALVIFTHSYGLTGAGNEEPFKFLTGLSASYIAVNVFFILSGFLITASWLNQPKLSIYISARVLRIFPALWVSIGACLFLVGPLFTALPLKDYFIHRDFYIFTFENSTLILRGVYHHLPGLFTNLPEAGIVNESLWTLPYELKMYIIVIIFGLIGAFKSPRIIVLIYLTFLAFYLIDSNAEVGGSSRLASYFMAGSVYYLYKDKIRLSWNWFVVLLSTVVTGYLESQSIGTVILTLVLPYLVFVLAYLPSGSVRNFNHFGDYSYGLYIYAFPIQQILVKSGIMNIYLHISMSYILTLIVAISSWHIIEKPALSRRARLASLLDVECNSFLAPVKKIFG